MLSIGIAVLAGGTVALRSVFLDAPALATSAPILIDIAPSSGPAGTAYPLRAIIRGTGFMPIGNTVTFGPAKIPNLPSQDGTRITCLIPKELPSRAEVPPKVLPPGRYQITVTTTAGTSNALHFTLTRGR